ncbi:MAG: hypothetical protein R3F20_12965 [Planctomycetota bacterium]
MTERGGLILARRQGRRPAVVWWFAGFCLLHVVGFVVVGVWLAASLLGLDEDVDELDGLSVFVSIASLGLSLVWAIGLVLPRRRAGWIGGIVLIALSLTCGGLVTALPAVPLLIFWSRRATRDWFVGRDGEGLADVFE